MSKTVFITGASSGIGKATAELFHANGWNVAATMRSPKDGAELERENMLVTRLDLLDSESIESAVSATINRFGTIDVLVNNAGYGAFGPFEATPMSAIRRQFDVNLFGLAEMTKAVLPGMRKQRGGTIINVSSVGGRVVLPFGTLYHGSKWAVEGLSEALDIEVRLFGGRVKIIEPAGVNTDFGSRSLVVTNDENIKEYQPLIKNLREAAEKRDSSANQEPEDVAQIIWEAATDGSDRLRYVTGESAHSLLSQRYSIAQDETFVVNRRNDAGTL